MQITFSCRFKFIVDNNRLVKIPNAKSSRSVIIWVDFESPESWGLAVGALEASFFLNWRCNRHLVELVI